MGPAVAEVGSALLGIAGKAAMAMQIVFSLFFFYESPAEIPILMMFPAGMLLISLLLLRAGLSASGTMASIGAAPITR